MLTTTQIAGFVGAGLAGAAYIPQISHLIRAHCSAGISRLAFAVWLLASLLITARAIAIHAGVFIVLGGIQIVATTLIMIYATRYKNTPCPIHHPRQPEAKTTTGTGTRANEPDSWPPAGRSIAESSDNSGLVRCGLPAEVEGRYTMRSTEGPLESARIRRPRGHWFNGPVDSLTLPQQSRGRDDGRAEGQAGLPDHGDHGGPGGASWRAPAL
jgi:hypothetical protein